MLFLLPAHHRISRARQHLLRLCASLGGTTASWISTQLRLVRRHMEEEEEEEELEGGGVVVL